MSKVKLSIDPSTKTALITGASSGIGEGFARLLAAQGFKLILVARRVDRLMHLISELQRDYPQDMYAFSVDLALPNVVDSLMQLLAEKGLSVDVLINNAGYSPKHNISQQSAKEVAQQLNVMVQVPTLLSHAVLPYMLATHYGRIINVSSLAAFAPPGQGSLYSAIKQYVLTFSHSLHADVANKNVYVTALCPGFTHTEFHEVMDVTDKASKLPKFLWTDVSFVVESGWYAVNKGQVVCVPGLINQTIGAVSKRLPERLRHYLGKQNPLA